MACYYTMLRFVAWNMENYCNIYHLYKMFYASLNFQNLIIQELELIWNNDFDKKDVTSLKSYQASQCKNHRSNFTHHTFEFSLLRFNEDSTDISYISDFFSWLIFLSVKLTALFYRKPNSTTVSALPPCKEVPPVFLEVILCV